MPLLSIPELLRKKRNAEEFTDSEINFFIDCVCKRNIDRSQIGAMLMAFCLNGLSARETITLTKTMMESGTVQKWDPSWKVVDKHSTGGVGDKVTFPLVAAVANFGLKLPMITGRGLGHTGGTADKLESIPGFNIALSDSHMEQTLADIGCYITCQFGNVAPADKTLYSIRDITSTVCYPPLICASIMSKKLAEGLQTLVLDVKTGIASTCDSYEQAEGLARRMVEIGHGMGVDTTAVITEMDTPIGFAIGNSLEMIESLECIQGRGPADLEQIVSVQGGILLFKAGLAPSQAAGEAMILRTFQDGSAFKKFSEILNNQGVSSETTELFGQGKYDEVFEKARYVEKILAPGEGHIESVNAMTLGRSCVFLGGGRQLPEDKIDMPVGIQLVRTKGDKVSRGDVLAEVHHNGRLTEEMKQDITNAFKIGDQHLPIDRILSIVQPSLPTQSYTSYRNSQVEK